MTLLSLTFRLCKRSSSSGATMGYNSVASCPDPIGGMDGSDAKNDDVEADRW